MSTTALLTLLADLPWPAILLLKVTLLLGVAWGIHHALSGKNPRWRVALWRGVAVALIALPVSQCLLPRLSVPVVAQPSTIPAEVDALGGMEGTTNAILAPGHSWPVAFAMVWLLVATAMAVRTLFGVRRVRALVRHSRRAPEHVRRAAAEMAECLGGTQVRLRVAGGVASPFLVGLRRPVVVLPDAMASTPGAPKLAAVLAHELAHVQSRDPQWYLVVKSISVLLWFHPLVWRIVRAHACACEEVCDAVAARHAGGAGPYAQTLARIALDAIHATVPGIAMAGRSEITGRLRALKRGIKADALRPSRVAIPLILATLAITTLGALELTYGRSLETAPVWAPLTALPPVARAPIERRATLNDAVPEDVEASVAPVTPPPARADEEPALQPGGRAEIPRLAATERPDKAVPELIKLKPVTERSAAARKASAASPSTADLARRRSELALAQAAALSLPATPDAERAGVGDSALGDEYRRSLRFDQRVLASTVELSSPARATAEKEAPSRSRPVDRPERSRGMMRNMIRHISHQLEQTFTVEARSDDGPSLTIGFSTSGARPRGADTAYMGSGL